MLLAVAVPFRNLVLYHFYIRGAFFRDEGIFAGILWHRGPWLLLSPIYATPQISFFELHIQPLFLVLNGISWLLPVTMAQFFAWVAGIGHALPPLGIFLIVTQGFACRSASRMVLGAALAIAFGFSGLALAIARFPHPEIIIAGGAILFLACLALQKPRAARAWFIITLLTREDAGFHLAGILVLVAAAGMLRGESFARQRGILIYAACGFVYALLSVAIQHRFFPTLYSPLTGVYLGHPPFHRLSTKLVALRLAGLPLFRPYFALPALFAAAWAIIARNPMIVVGYLAFLPWLLLQVCADSEIAGTLSGYYAFPFMISAAWPLIALTYQARRAGGLPHQRALALFALMVALSFTGLSWQWNDGLATDLPQAFTSPPSLQAQGRTDGALRALSRANQVPGGRLLGVLRIDQSVAALSPYGFRLADLYEPGKTGLGDTLVYFKSGPQAPALQAALATAAFPYRGEIAGTPLSLASNRPLAGLIAEK